jgi:FtsH-binding integral membrane protein
MDGFPLDYPIIMHLLILLDENQIIEMAHKRYEQIMIYTEFANYFVRLLK